MATIYVVWGSTYLAIKVSVETLPAAGSLALRFLMAGALMIGALIVLRRWQRPTAAEMLGASIVGCWMLIGGVGGITLVETRIPSNVAAVIASMAALYVVAFRVIDGDRPARRTVVAIATGIVGVALLLLPGSRAIAAPLLWVVLAPISPFLWGSGSYYASRVRLPASPLVTAAVETMAAGIAFAAIALVLDGASLGIDDPSRRSLLAVAYLAVASSIAFSAYVWLLDRIAISTVVTHQYVNPIVAVILGWLVLDERLTPVMLAAMALIIGAVAVIVRTTSTR